MLFTSEKDCEDKMGRSISGPGRRRGPLEIVGVTSRSPESACSPLEKQAFYLQNLQRITSLKHTWGLIKATENNLLNLSDDSLPNTLAFHTNARDVVATLATLAGREHSVKLKETPGSCPRVVEAKANGMDGREV